MGMTIRLKLFFLIISTLVLTAAIFFGTVSLIIEKMIVKEFEDNLHRHYVQMNDDFRPGMNYKEFLRRNEKGLRGFITLFDPSTAILASTSPELSHHDRLPHSNHDDIAAILKKPDLFFETYVTILEGINVKALIGIGKLSENHYVFIEKPLEVVSDAISISLKAMGISLIFVLLISIGLAYLFSSAFTRPILAIKKKALAIADQDFSEDVYIKSKDEFGDLGSTMNNISHTLDKSLTELSDTCLMLEHVSQTDALTGLANRLKIDKVLEDEVYKADFREKIFSLILMDIDFFKKVNDTYGHLTGDHVLKEFAHILIEKSRQTDTIGRWGGEEFIVILPDTDLENAQIAAEKLRTSVEQFDFEPVGRKTASFGVCQYEKGSNLNDTISNLDEALYRAKETGRNKVEMSLGRKH